MSRAKKTKRAKAYSLTHRYRQITELLNRDKKRPMNQVNRTKPVQEKDV